MLQRKMVPVEVLIILGAIRYGPLLAGLIVADLVALSVLAYFVMRRK